MPIPVDFEKVVKLPDANGYPYSLRSDDLMKNFAWCDLLPSDGSDGIRIELDEVVGVTQQHKQRRLRIGGETVNVLVVENGVFKTGDFFVSGTLTTV